MNVNRYKYPKSTACFFNILEKKITGGGEIQSVVDLRKIIKL